VGSNRDLFLNSEKRAELYNRSILGGVFEPNSIQVALAARFVSVGNGDSAIKVSSLRLVGSRKRQITLTIQAMSVMRCYNIIDGQ